MENSEAAVVGLEYWLQWQVLVCALIFVLPTAIAIGLLRKRRGSVKDPLKPVHMWAPCWRNLHPRWLLFYRAFAFVAMAFLLYQTVAAFGLFVFFFYTQWTFALVMVYFATCAGAVTLTDIVFWGLLLPFMTGENFQLTLLIGCMHSVNAVFLIIESALNRLPFTWFGLIYFVLWSCAYVVSQWVLHACCFTWWPYPFLELSTPWAPLWYLALAVIHLPCYGLYVLLTKAKHVVFSRIFPHAFVRFPTEEKRV